MHAKEDLRKKAIKLRRQGKTYSEICSIIPVAKSTLSLWFHGVGLATYQTQRISQKRIEGQKKGAEARRNQRIQKQNTIWEQAEREIGTLSRRELWLIGIALYWAEGSKEKEWSVGQSMRFSNSDPKMIQVFIEWVRVYFNFDPRDLSYSLYIHESKKQDISSIISFWSKQTDLPESVFNKVYFKKTRHDSKRKNIGILYNGQLRVSIPKSTLFMRKVEGWVRGIYNNCRVV